MAEPVCHLELQVADPARCKAFYAAAFGWQSRPAAPGYEWLDLGGAVTGGIMTRKSAGQDGLTVYLGVTDLTAALARVHGAGGAVVQEPRDVPGHGRYAVIADPEGNRFGLWERSPR